MSAAQWRLLAQRLLARFGSTVTWTRRTLTADGPEGTVTEDDSEDFEITAAQLSEDSRTMFGSEGWQSAQIRLCVAAIDLPFENETHSGFPEVHFDDVVTWLGVPMRVVAIEGWSAPSGGDGPLEPCAFYVGLSA